MTTLFKVNSILDASPKLQNFNGEPHVVVPVTAFREGIFNGHFYTESALKANYKDWEGVPVPVGHPKVNGEHVSAKQPQFEATQNIGTFRNVSFHDKKLKGEIWVNVGKAVDMGYSDLVGKLVAGQTIGVSVASFATPIETYEYAVSPYGKYNSKIDAVVPDHLAILPEGGGACSIADGCGTMKVNTNADCGCESSGTLGSLKSFITNLMWKELKNEGVESLKANEALAEAKKKHEDKVSELIANSATRFDESDRSRLLALESEILDKFKSMFESIFGSESSESDEASTVKTVVDTIADAKSAASEAPEIKSVDTSPPETNPVVEENSVENKENVNSDIKVNALSDEDMALFSKLKANEDVRIEEIRKDVLNAFPTLSDTLVANMAADTLEALHSGIKPQGDFSGKMGSGTKTMVANKEKRRIRSIVLPENDNKET